MSTQARRRIPRPALSLLAFMMAIGPFGDTEYTPSMPAIAQSLNVDYALVQLTMASYLVGLAVSDLFYGPLADRYGRRPVMLWGAAILTLGAVMCLVSFSIGPLIAGRLVQGVGACAGGVVAKAAVRDAFRADQRERVYAQLNAAFALAPALGPVVGSVVGHALGWHANFAILVALSVLLWLLVWRYLPETKPRLNRRALEPVRLWRNYKRPLTKPSFLYYTVLGGCAIGVVYTALIGAPHLVISVLGRGTFAVIIVAVAILIGFVAGASLCAFLSKRLADMAILAAGLGVLVAGSLALLAVGLTAGKQGTLAMFLTPIAFCFTGVGLVVPVSTTNAMAPFAHTAGAASSLLGFTRMGIAAIGTVTMSLLPQSSVHTMPIVFLALSGAAVMVLLGYTWLYGVPAAVGAEPHRRRSPRPR